MSKSEIVVLQRFLLCLPICILVLAWTGLWMRQPIAHWQFPVATCFALLISIAGLRDSRKIARSLILCGTVLVLALWLSCSLFEISFDGRAYHNPPAYAMSDGWNPIYMASLCQWEDAFCDDPALIYMEHYPKAQWLIAAVMYKSLGHIEAGNAINVLMLLAALLYSNQVLGELPGLGAAWRRGLAFVIAFNPVTIAQLYTSYIDGLIASMLTIYVLSLSQYLVTCRMRALLPAMLVLPYLINLKFSALAYAAFLGVGFAVAYLVYHRRIPGSMIATGLCISSISIAILGFNPYMQNVLQDKHVFYPVYLNDGSKSNTVDRQADAQFIARDRFSKFFIASYSREKEGVGGWVPQFKIPLTWLKPQRSPDPRFSGFGPLFGIALGFSLLQIFFVRSTRLLIPIALLTGSVFLTDAGWWPRLAPQAWLVVCLVQAAHLLQQRKGWIGLARTMVVLLSINSLVVTSLLTTKYFENAQEIRRDVSYAVKSGSPVMLRKDDTVYFNSRKLRDIGESLEVVASCTEARSNALFITCAPNTENQ